MQVQHSFEFIKTMTRYGVILGCMIGAVGAIPVALTWFDISILLPVMALFIIITMCGGLVGMVYGGVSGFISGMLMTLATHFAFKRMNQAHLYKITMGFLAVLTTFSLFMFDLIFIGGHQADFFTRSIPITDWIAVWSMALLFAIYASQRTASEYLQYHHAY